MSLKPARHIIQQDWMNTRQIRKIFDILQDSAAQPQILFVGGCVRNVLMKREVEDLDLACVHPPLKVMQMLEAGGVSVVPTGIDHGTVMAVIDGMSFEITTLRRDVETDGRHAVVDFTDCWVEDAKRRDFTMNTLLLDLKGNIYDPLGQGLADLDAGVIRFVGQADKRIEEDYLRILRFFRFHAIYGRGDFDADALGACAKGAKNIASLSRERITQEFCKIILSDKAPQILRLMFDHGILADIAFTKDEQEFFTHFCTFQSRYGLGALSSRLFVFAGLDLAKIELLQKYMIFPKVFLKDMQAINGALTFFDLSCDAAVRQSIYKFGRSITAQSLMIELVQDRVMNGYAPAAIKIIQGWDVPDFPINGNDLMALGVAKSPALGKALEDLENWWIAQDFKPSRDEILNYFEASSGGSGIESSS